LQLLGFSNDRGKKRVREDHDGQRFDFWGVKKNCLRDGFCCTTPYIQVRGYQDLRRMGIRRRSIFNV